MTAIMRARARPAKFPNVIPRVGLLMSSLTTPLLGRACRIFLELAYPDGPDSIPAVKRLYWDVPSEQPVEQFLPPVAEGVGHTLPPQGAVQGGYALRLGSAGYANLKLTMQRLRDAQGDVWVFMVDTHDAFSPSSFHPPRDHPDAATWLALQARNRQLKEQIENALAQAGLVTLNSLLKQQLQ